MSYGKERIASNGYFQRMNRWEKWGNKIREKRNGKKGRICKIEKVDCYDIATKWYVYVRANEVKRNVC